MTDERNEFNSRRYQGRLERELIAGGIGVGFVLGAALIYLFWGASAVITAIGCFGMFAVLGLAIWAFLALLGRLGGAE